MGSSQSTQAESIQEESTEAQPIQDAVELVSRWHLDLEKKVIFDSGSSAITQYLGAIDEILQSDPDHREELQNVIFMAVARLKFEFRTILTRQTRPFHLYILKKLKPESVRESGLSSSITDSSSYESWCDDFAAYDAPKKEELHYLRNIAERTNSCGHLIDCVEVYKSIRKHFVDSIMKRLRLEELQAGNTKKMLLEVLQIRTNRWIKVATICIKLLLVEEKQMAKQIFGGISGLTAEELFLNVVKDAVTNLFSFAQSVNASHQSSERLEIILILCNALSSLAPYVNDLFQFESSEGVRNRILAIVSGLEDDVRRMLSDFERAVLCEVSNISDEVVAVHSMTENVMGHLHLLECHWKLLMRVIVTKPSMTNDSSEFPNGELLNPSNPSPLALHIILIIANLQTNLEDKSRKYKNAWFRNLFVEKNVQFIKREIESSSVLRDVVGTDYLETLTHNVKQGWDSVQAMTCERLLRCLEDDDAYLSWCFCRRVSTSALRKRIKSFNSFCEDMLLFQAPLEAGDFSLWEENHRWIMLQLLPAYEGFVQKYRNRLKSGESSKLSILTFRKISVKYSVDDLKALLPPMPFITGSIA